MTVSKKTTPRGAREIYQLKITLKGGKPPIWRRVQVLSEMTLARLHEVIQAAMDWADSHLHEFTIDGESFSPPDFDNPDPGDFDEKKAQLRQWVGDGDSFLYVYDFGDDWVHQITVEKVLPAEDGILYPRCVAGRRACPPEDIGGIWGYQVFLEAIGDPKHPEHRQMKEWIGGPFDPESFDPEAVNLRFRRSLISPSRRAD